MSAPLPKPEQQPPASAFFERQRAIPRSSKVSQAVASAILDEIVARELKTGDRLPTEATMLKEFDVGRASIREALRILEVYGLIEIRQGQRGGPYVTAVDPGDLGRTLTFFFHATGATYDELLEARLLIEPALARLAAERRDARLLTELQAVIDREQSAPEEDYLNCANAFHYTVAGASGNRVLDLLGRSMRGVYAERLSVQNLFPHEGRPQVRRLHVEIGEAIINGDGELAELLMRRHLKELADMQRQLTPWVMQERVEWRG